MLDALQAHWRGHADAQLARALHPRNAGRTLALDFDNTCIEGDTGELLHLYLSEQLAWDLPRFAEQIAPEDGQGELKALIDAYHHGEPVREALVDALMVTFPRRLRREGALRTYTWATALHAGQEVQELQRHARAMLERESQRPRTAETFGGPHNESLTIMRGIRSRLALGALIDEAKAQGLCPWVISATNEWTVQVAAEDLGVPAARVLGNRSVVREGRITHERDAPVTWRHGKVQAYERYVSGSEPPVLAVGDSWTDFELLEFAEDAILIDRGDAPLREEARSRGWAVVPAEALASVPWGTLSRALGRG